jgi:sodium/hydrogen antiporter
MGVGAVFISTLAQTRLPEPHDPPANQTELLAACLQPIVSFVVLGSIILREIMFFRPYLGSQISMPADGLSIPFFSFGRTVSTRTLSLTATLTTRSRAEAPDWLLWIRRAPGTPREPGMSVTSTRIDIERDAGGPRDAPEAVPQRIEVSDSLPSETLDLTDTPNLTRRSTRDNLKVLFHTFCCLYWF